MNFEVETPMTSVSVDLDGHEQSSAEPTNHSMQSSAKSKSTSESDVHVIMLGEALFRMGGIVTFQKLLIESLPEQVSMRHLGTVGLGGPLSKLLKFLVCWIKLVAKLIATRVDVAHLHCSLEASFYRQCLVALTCFAFRKPVLMHIHAGEFPSYYRKINFASQWLGRFVFSRSNLIILTDSWRPFYINDIGVKPENIHTMPNPVPLPELTRIQRDQASCQFVHLGKMDPDKGTFDLLEAIASCADDLQKNNAKFVVAGNGMVDEVRQRVTELGISNCVDVRDWINATERDELLSQSDVFVLPSYFEGMPMSLLEAMSWAMPVLTTPVGGIPDFVTDDENGRFINPGDVKALGDAIVELASHPQLRQDLGSAGRRRVENHCPIRYANEAHKLYLDISTRNSRN